MAPAEDCRLARLATPCRATSGSDSITDGLGTWTEPASAAPTRRIAQYSMRGLFALRQSRNHAISPGADRTLCGRGAPGDWIALKTMQADLLRCSIGGPSVQLLGSGEPRSTMTPDVQKDTGRPLPHEAISTVVREAMGAPASARRGKALS